MGLFTWLMGYKNKGRSKTIAPSHRQPVRSRTAPRFRPLLEALEDRRALSTIRIDLNSEFQRTFEQHLRSAVTLANQDSDIDVIELNGFYPGLQNCELHSPLTITSPRLKIMATNPSPDYSGYGPGPLTVTYHDDASSLDGFPLFEVTEGSTVTLENLKVMGPYHPLRRFRFGEEPRWINNAGTLIINSSVISSRPITEGGNGDAIHNSGTLTVNHSNVNDSPGIYNSGTLTVNASTINKSSGIRNRGTLIVDSSVISNNQRNAIANSGILTVSGSYFIGNLTPYEGGAIFNSGTAKVKSSTFGGNLASYGGAIYSTGSMAVDSSMILGNIAIDGGGIYSEGPLTVSASTFSENVASLNGGAIANDRGAVWIMSSTLRDNLATYGGGIWNIGSVTVDSSTLSANSADYGGGIANDHGTVWILSSTLSGNSAIEGGGIWSNSGTTTLTHTIVANSSSGGDIAGMVVGARNLVEDDSGGLVGSITGDPLLGALADNGGPTFTHALLPGSPAIDAGDNILVLPGLTTDQRGAGYARVRGQAIDIGAFEVIGLPATPLADAGTTEEDTAVRIEVLANDSDPDNDPLTLVAITQPSHGVAVINVDGTVTYTPAPNYNGTDSFTYTASDGYEGAATATVSVTVTAVNDAPTLVLPGALWTAEDAPGRIGVIGVADIDVKEGDGQVSVILTVVSGKLVASTSSADGLTAAQIVGNGTAQVILWGSIKAVNTTLQAGISYRPDVNFNGNDALSVTVNDLGNFGAGGTLTATGSLVIHVSSPAEQIADLQERVRVLQELGVVSPALARTLLIKLSQANLALLQGKTKVAYHLIGAFSNQVEELIDSGTLTTAAAPLLSLARVLRTSLLAGLPR